MNNLQQTQAFEKKKNMMAGAYTLGTAVVLLLCLLLLGWQIPVIPPPVADLGVEVNLGNSDFGHGDIAPSVPGEPAPEPVQQQASTPPTTAPQPTPEKTEPDPNDHEPSINKPVDKPRSQVKPHDNPPVPKPVQSQAPPTPPAPKPKATMGNYTGGKGTGGNNADKFNGVKNQGIVGGNGDQGKPNGNPNSDNYNGSGGSGKSGITVSRGLSGRHIAHFPSFEDDFNQNAKIAMDITVDETGNVTSATYQSRGSTSADSDLKSIAKNKAMQLKFNAGSGEGSGTIIFNFRLKN